VARTATVIDQWVTADLQNAECAPSRAVSCAYRRCLLGPVGSAHAVTLGIHELPIDGPRSPFGGFPGRSRGRFHGVRSEASSANEALAVLVTNQSGAISERYVGPLFFRSGPHQPSIPFGELSGPGRNGFNARTTPSRVSFLIASPTEDWFLSVVRVAPVFPFHPNKNLLGHCDRTRRSRKVLLCRNSIHLRLLSRKTIRI
jgi:hypothetical protein